MSSILVISSDVIDHKMAGVGIRYWEIAHALASSHDITLAIPNQTSLTSKEVKLVSYDRESGDLRAEADSADAILLQGFILHFHPYLKDIGIPIIVDLYVPYLLENLVWHAEDELENWIPAYEEYLRVQLELLRVGDFFICASERQRDYWIGWLHAQKRINPHTYAGSPDLRHLIDVVPFGLPSRQPSPASSGIKGKISGIEPEDKVILWGGGIWDWLDPLTLIRAMEQLSESHPEFKLYFMGTEHPNPIVVGMQMAEQAKRLSQDLGLYERTVFFGDWVSYDEREAILLEADLGIVTHLAHVETRFSFRTRALDYIWAGLPILISEGDVIAEWVQEYDIGDVIPVGDVNATCRAIVKLLSERHAKNDKAFEKLRRILSWEAAVRPLRQYLENPQIAPDKGEYLTELERISRDKDAFLDQVITDKDNYFDQVIADKNAQFERSGEEREAHWTMIFEQKSQEITRVNIKHQATVSKIQQNHLEQIKEKEREIEALSEANRFMKQAHEIAQSTNERMQKELEERMQQIEYFRRLLPVRIWRKFRHWIGRE